MPYLEINDLKAVVVITEYDLLIPIPEKPWQGGPPATTSIESFQNLYQKYYLNPK